MPGQQARPDPLPAPGGLFPCRNRKCRASHQPVDVLRWLWALRETKPKPAPGQLAALTFLALRLDPSTGCGWVYNAQIADDAGGVSEDTVSRATQWARDRLLLHRAVKGGRLGDGSKTATLWVLLQPAPAPPQTRAGAGLTSKPRRAGVDRQTRAGAGLTRHLKPANDPASNPQEDGSTGTPMKGTPKTSVGALVQTVDGSVAPGGAAATEGDPMSTSQQDTLPIEGLPPVLPTAKGTRVPEDLPARLRADAALRAWFRENCPNVDGALEMDQFMDHWRAASGQAASKRDWVATWRKWMRKAQQDAGRGNGQVGSPAHNGGQRHKGFHLTDADRAAYHED